MGSLLWDAGPPLCLRTNSVCLTPSPSVFGFTLSSRIRFGDTYDRSVTIGAWLSVVPGQQMHNQSINPSVPFATQLSIFVKGQVFVPPNPFSFGKHRDGIGLELAKFFAHSFAVITNINCKNPYCEAQPYARTIPAFRVSFTRRSRYMMPNDRNISLSFATRRRHGLIQTLQFALVAIGLGLPRK